MLEVPEVDDFDVYAADVEVEGEWDFSELTGGPDLGHLVSLCIDYEPLREVCQTANISLS